MAFVIAVVFINIQLKTDESFKITGLSQSNQRSVYENEYVCKAAICILVRIALLAEHPAEPDKLTFIKRNRAFSKRKIAEPEISYGRVLYFFFFFFLKTMIGGLTQGRSG